MGRVPGAHRRLRTGWERAVPFGRRAVRRQSASQPDHEWSDAQRLRYWWQAERELLLRALDAVPPDAANEPLHDDAWSPQGIAAHRLFWEAEERAAIEEHLGGAFPSLLDFPNGRIDSTNAAAVDSLGDRQLTALVRALADLRSRTATLVERIPDEDLNAQGNPARILLGVALEHDREHRRELEARFGATRTDD
ncbi:MAG: DinB family protein [Chloroflexi bacterium]|nr:DinB family protein [Chloroflexota bacterium]MYF81080.1 DinB family protein [Chloroflexota bacterium]MYI04266.1 DinB family protein [Chloroflexota bacterium]